MYNFLLAVPNTNEPTLKRRIREFNPILENKIEPRKNGFRSVKREYLSNSIRTDLDYRTSQPKYSQKVLKNTQYESRREQKIDEPSRIGKYASTRRSKALKDDSVEDAYCKTGVGLSKKISTIHSVSRSIDSK